MRLRGKALVATIALAATPTLLLALVASGILAQFADSWLAGGALVGADAAAGHGDGAAPALLVAALAARQALWLAAAALTCLATALGLVLVRRHFVEPAEALARRLDADVGRHADELSAIAARADALVRVASRAENERQGQLDAVRSALERAGDQLVEAQRLGITGRLALGAAHEIGSPLSIAIATVDALRAGAAAEGLLPALDEALTRVDEILRELSRFGRPEASRPEAVDLAALAHDVVRLARLHPRARRVAIAVHSPEAAVVAWVPRRQLEQVLLNLLINAADATQERGSVDVHCGLELTPGGAARAMLLVDDDGPGVPDHLRDRIFEPFFTSKAADVGTGLGLAISRRLVVAAGGTLEVERSPSHGARFAVRLPWADQAPGAASSLAT